MMRRIAGRSPGVHSGKAAAWVTSLVAVSLLAVACGTRSPESVRTGAGTNSVFTYDESPAWGTSWSFNPFSSNSLSYYYEPTCLLPLATAEPKAGQYLPQIATSWQVTSSAVTIHLRKQAKWQDGSPVTSTDVLDSMMLNGTLGSDLWAYTTQASTRGPKELVFKVPSKADGEVLLSDALQTFPVQAKVYGRFLPPHFQQTLFAYAKLEVAGSSKASSSPAGKRTQAVLTKLERFAPKSLVGDGPFKLGSVTTDAIIFKRSPSFWGAAKVHVGEIDYLGFAANQDSYAAMLANRIDGSATAMTASVVTTYLQKRPTDKIATPAAYSEYTLYFNDHDKPLNETPVRQAIASLLNRAKINNLSMGPHTPNTTVAKPDGLFYTLNKEYLSAAQYKSLDSYSYDPARAAQLLRSAHFKKVGGKWLMPNGKPFTESLVAPSGENDVISMALAIGNELTNFGIKTQVQAIDGGQVSADLSNGHFEMDINLDGYGTSPLAWPDGYLGPDENFPSSGFYKGDRGIGYGPTEQVKGLGDINISNTVNAESLKYYTPAQTRHLTFVWARFMNQQLPVLPLVDKNVQFEYSTARFGDWPAANNPLWKLVGLGGDHQGLIIMMEEGYVRPKS